MSGVSPTGFTNGAGRSETAKFFSQSENDVAAAFAELLKYEGLSPESEPPSPPPPPAAGPQKSSRESSASTPSESSADPTPASASATSAEPLKQTDDETERDDEEEVVASAAAPSPVATPQTPQVDQAPVEGVSSVEESELEAILATARSVQQEIDLTGAQQASAESETLFAPIEKEAEDSAETPATDAVGVVAEQAVVVDPAADLSPKVFEPSDTEILEPIRRSGLVEEESDQEEGFAVDDSADDSGVDEATLAEVIAKAAATAEARPGKTDERETKPKTDRQEKVDAVAGVDSATRAGEAPSAADASPAVVASVSAEATLSATKADSSAVDSVGANVSASGTARHEATGSLQRSIERPTEADRRQLTGLDRSRFFDRVERAFKSAEQGDGSIRMRLHPSELGSLQLTLEQGESGEWIARIETETQEARQTLLEHAGALKERLADQDFRLERFEVETQSDRRQQHAPDFQENPQSFSRGRDRQDDERRGEDRSAEAAPASPSPGDRSRRLDVTI